MKEKIQMQRIWDLLLCLFLLIIVLCTMLVVESGKADREYIETWRPEQAAGNRVHRTEEPEIGTQGEGVLKDNKGNLIVRYHIPEGFQEDDLSSDDFGNVISYLSDDFTISVNLAVWEEDTWKEQPLDDVADFLEGFGKTVRDVQMEEINGYHVYYGCADPADVSKKGAQVSCIFYAVVKLHSGKLLRLQAFSNSQEETRELSMYRQFLTLEESEKEEEGK